MAWGLISLGAVAGMSAYYLRGGPDTLFLASEAPASEAAAPQVRLAALLDVPATADAASSRFALAPSAPSSAPLPSTALAEAYKFPSVTASGVPAGSYETTAHLQFESVEQFSGDVARVRGWYARMLKEPGVDVRRDDVGGAGARFRIGPHTFDFVAPATASSPLAAWIAARGPSPYAATFRGAAGRSPLDSARTHGARLAHA